MKTVSSLVTAEPPEPKRTRILLLGTGDVGKTTLLRQMHLLFKSSELSMVNEVPHVPCGLLTLPL